VGYDGTGGSGRKKRSSLLVACGLTLLVVGMHRSASDYRLKWQVQAVTYDQPQKKEALDVERLFCWSPSVRLITTNHNVTLDPTPFKKYILVYCKSIGNTDVFG